MPADMLQLIPLVAPAAAFVAIALLGAGFYRGANNGGLLVRRKLAAFVATPSGETAPVQLEVSSTLLLKTQRFSAIPSVDRLLRRWDLASRFSLDLAKAALPMRVSEYLLTRALAGLCLFVVLRASTDSVLIGLVGAVTGWLLPALYVRWRQGRRVRQFEDQLVDALVLIANALKSGYSFLQGMEAISREMPEPIGAEFEQALREVRVGGSAEDALMGISRRVASDDFELVVTAMIIQRQVGGNLSEILGSIAHTVRERHRILREVRVLTAQERLSGYVIAALPVFLIILLSILSPHYIEGMWQASSGKLLLVTAFVMQLLGLLVIRKVVEIDV